jgi:hypothetical protein
MDQISQYKPKNILGTQIPVHSEDDCDDWEALIQEQDQKDLELFGNIHITEDEDYRNRYFGDSYCSEVDESDCDSDFSNGSNSSDLNGGEKFDCESFDVNCCPLIYEEIVSEPDIKDTFKKLFFEQILIEFELLYNKEIKNNTSPKFEEFRLWSLVQGYLAKIQNLMSAKHEDSVVIGDLDGSMATMALILMLNGNIDLTELLEEGPEEYLSILAKIIVKQSIVLNDSIVLSRNFDQKPNYTIYGLQDFQSNSELAISLNKLWIRITPLLNSQGDRDLVFIGDIIFDRCSLLQPSQVMSYLSEILKSSNNVTIILGNHDLLISYETISNWKEYPVDNEYFYRCGNNDYPILLQSGFFAYKSLEQKSYEHLQNLFSNLLTLMQFSYFDKNRQIFYTHNGFDLDLDIINNKTFLRTALSLKTSDKIMNFIDLELVESWEHLSTLMNQYCTVDIVSSPIVQNNFCLYRPKFADIKVALEFLNAKFKTQVRVVYGHDGNFSVQDPHLKMVNSRMESSPKFILSVYNLEDKW